MKKYIKPVYLPYFVVGTGFIGMLLRIWLLTGGTDDKGLIKPWHPAEILLWLLTAAVLALLFWQTGRLTGGTKYRYNYPASMPGAVGVWLGALAIFVNSAAQLLSSGDTLMKISALTGLLAVPVLIYVGWCRWKGQPLSVLCHSFVCVHMLLHLICLYRQWCSDPQLMDYCFQLLSIVCLALSLFHRASFDARMGNRRWLALTHLAGVFFSLIAIPGSGWYFHLCAAVWMYTDLCSLKLVRPKPAQE